MTQAATSTPCFVAGLVAAAYVRANTKYDLGAKGMPGTKSDCSGLVSQSYPGIGVGTGAQHDNTALVSFENMKDGDLAFMTTQPNKPLGHVGLIGGVTHDKDGKLTGFNVTHMSSTRNAVTDHQEVKNGVIQPRIGTGLRNVFREVRTWKPETDPPR
ncbi:MAG TPA: NlpC/P60 family protein [Gallionellaceae bacterium]|nr:NlpC/P60 family protein [Gallionellaceae bacterium]